MFLSRRLGLEETFMMAVELVQFQYVIEQDCLLDIVVETNPRCNEGCMSLERIFNLLIILKGFKVLGSSLLQRGGLKTYL